MWSIHAFLSALLGCTPKTPTATTDATPPPPHYWLRNTRLLIPQGDLPTSTTIRGPTLVELLPGGRVRSLPGAQPAFDGYLPESAVSTPSDRAGLMLYAQRETELHDQSPTGPVIGWLHPGAMVSVVPDDNSAFVRVGIPRYKDGNHTLLAYVDRTALATTPIAQVTPTLTGNIVRDFPFDLWLQDPSRAFSRLLCGEFAVVETGGQAIVDQYHDGVQIHGRIDSGWYWEHSGPARCAPRLVYTGPDGLVIRNGKDWLDSLQIDAIPSGFANVDLPPDDPLAHAIVNHTTVYWLIETNKGLQCHAWKFNGQKAPPSQTETRPVFEGELRRQHDPLMANFPLNYWASLGGRSLGDLQLWGPHFLNGGYKCVQNYVLVGATHDRFYIYSPGLIPPDAPPRDHDLVAFPPDEMEHWFLSKKTCESAKESATIALKNDPRSIHGLGLHFDCYDELHQ